jgi:hypothetical protein
LVIELPGEPPAAPPGARLGDGFAVWTVFTTEDCEAPFARLPDTKLFVGFATELPVAELPDAMLLVGCATELPVAELPDAKPLGDCATELPVAELPDARPVVGCAAMDDVVQISGELLVGGKQTPCPTSVVS